MRILAGLYLPTLFIIFLLSCSGTEVKKDVPVGYPENENPSGETQGHVPPDMPETELKEYNFKFVGYDINIDDPVLDRRSYFKIYIDKVDAGRTTIGLESQKKSFESKISINRHLLTVEKWVLDEKKGQYVKLNNIDQPKPSYLYFDLPDDKAVVIILKNDPVSNKSEFELEFE